MKLGNGAITRPKLAPGSVTPGTVAANAVENVNVQDGALSVAEGGGDADPDATISASGETFDKIIAGEQNATTAYMTGKLKIKGDMGAAMKLQKLFG